MRAVKIILKIMAWIAASVLLALVALQVVLSPAVCTRLVNRYAPQFVDGKVEMSRIYVSIFSHFPAVTANMEDFAITYPSAEGGVDTLASFKRFTAAVNVLSLARGVINVKTLELMGPRASVRFAGDGTSNLDILKFRMSREDDVEKVDPEKEDSLTVIPPVIVRNVRLGDGARVKYSDARDTLETTIILRNFSLSGRLVTNSLQKSRFRMNLDTLVTFGRKGADSLFFNLDHLHISSRHSKMIVDASAKAFLATRAFGRIKVPLAFSGAAEIGRTEKEGEGVWNLDLRNVKMNVATVDATMEMKASFGDSLSLDGVVAIPDLDLQKLLDGYASNFYSEASKIKTDAHLKAEVSIKGDYISQTGELPAFNATLDVGRCRLSHSDFKFIPSLEIHAGASAAQGGPVAVDVRRLTLSSDGLEVNLSGTLDDALAGGMLDADASIAADLAPLGRQFSDMLNMTLCGTIEGTAKGKLNLRKFDVFNPSTYDVKAGLAANGLRADSFDDSLHVFVDSAALRVAMMEDIFKIGSGDGKKTIGAMLKVDSLFCNYRDVADINGRSIRLMAQSSPEKRKMGDGKEYNPIVGRLDIGSLFLEGQDSLAIRLRDSKNTLRFTPDANGSPNLKIDSRSARLMARSGVHRAFLKNLGFSANAALASRKPMRRRAAGDSARVRARRFDTSYLYSRKWMSEADFRKADIHFDMGETFRKYFTAWNVQGALTLDRGAVATPAFPLRTSVSEFKGSFSNDAVSIETLHLKSGASSLSAGGSISNLRRVLTGGGLIKMGLKVQTDSLSLSELMSAYAIGRQNMQTDLAYLARVDDDSYEDAVAGDVDSAETQALLVIPANVDAHVSLRGKGVTFAGLDITGIGADLNLKNRCLQLKDVRAETTVGTLNADAFYSTATKKDICAGFDVSLCSIEAGNVIRLLPGIDTIMPLLNSFDGLLDCNVAATTQLDTNMNLILPSLEGVLKISGKDLHFSDNRQLTRLARLLLFKNPKRAAVDSMTVEGVIRDNRLEVFPFLLDIDRWTFALAGIQNLDKSFQYHVSIARTPMLIKLGANLYGPDFDNMKFRIGKARYKDAGKVPSFSQMIDTTRINLVSSIRNVFTKGVKKALSDNRERHNFIMKKRAEQGYARSAALDSIETLSSVEQIQVDSLSVADSVVVLKQ